MWDPGAVREAKDAGVAFVVTPVLLPEVAEACRQEDILCVLGALTPTEIYQARLAGAALVKVFPIGPVGGVEYVRALNGPMGGVPFWVSGGVPIEDIGAYLRLGVKVVGLTASLFPPEALAHRDFELIRRNANRVAEVAAAAIAVPARNVRRSKPATRSATTRRTNGCRDRTSATSSKQSTRTTGRAD